MRREEKERLISILTDYIFCIESGQPHHACAFPDPRDCLCIKEAKEVMNKLQLEIKIELGNEKHEPKYCHDNEGNVMLVDQNGDYQKHPSCKTCDYALKNGRFNYCNYLRDSFSNQFYCRTHTELVKQRRDRGIDL